MGAVAVAISSSVLAGASAGVLIAALSRGTVRPRRSLRDHGRLARSGAASIAVGATLLTGAGLQAVRHDRLTLAFTCGAVALLIAFACWLLLVEPDDHDYPAATPNDPEWWPAFERDFEMWTREARVPSGHR